MALVLGIIIGGSHSQFRQESATPWRRLCQTDPDVAPHFATPDKKKIGTNKMQMQRVETKAGIAIWAVSSRAACNYGRNVIA
jgi:hypothetical protein